MARTKQVSLKESYLSDMIPGYRGYSPADMAHKTDQVFSEEVLSRLSETMAFVKRIERAGSEWLDPESLVTLESVAESVDNVSACLSDAKTINQAGLESAEGGRVEEVIDLDSEILDKIGNINQALSMLDLEGGVGTTPDELEAVVELLDDLGDSIRQRVLLLEG
jgi:hypothetical protein